MPIYEYRCEACGRQHEALQKISDKPLRACPSCGKRALKRLMSAPRFRLKGEGWYETDFKSDKDKKRNLAENGGDSAQASAGESGSDSGGSKPGDKTGDKASDKSGNKAGDKAEKAAKPAEPKAGDTSRAKPAAVRKRGLARRRSPGRRN
jgi:putative FmdB family regulatory protein